jgi:hypothetical protein
MTTLSPSLLPFHFESAEMFFRPKVCCHCQLFGSKDFTSYRATTILQVFLVIPFTIPVASVVLYTHIVEVIVYLFEASFC